MSTFIKRQPARVLDLGTRPGINGQVLVSTGVAGLDKLLGGGLPLGSLLLVLEDSHSQQHLNLLKCFLAEGVCCKHSLALITGQQLDLQAVAEFLPDLAKSSSSAGQVRYSTSSKVHVNATAHVPSLDCHSSWGPALSLSVLLLQAASTTTSSSSKPSSSSTAAAEAAAGPTPAAATAPEDGLKIAWQYRKYIQNQQRTDSCTLQQPQRSSKASSSTSSAAAGAAALAAGVGREWCHQFDLTKCLTADAVRAAKLQLACCCTQQQQGASAVAAAAEVAAGFLANHQPKGPIPGEHRRSLAAQGQSSHAVFYTTCAVCRSTTHSLACIKVCQCACCSTVHVCRGRKAPARVPGCRVSKSRSSQQGPCFHRSAGAAVTGLTRVVASKQQRQQQLAVPGGCDAGGCGEAAGGCAGRHVRSRGHVPRKWVLLFFFGGVRAARSWCATRWVWTESSELNVDGVPCVALCVCAGFFTGLYSESSQVHLQHLADVVLCVQSLADDSDIYRLLPDPTR